MAIMWNAAVLLNAHMYIRRGDVVVEVQSWCRADMCVSDLSAQSLRVMVWIYVLASFEHVLPERIHTSQAVL